MFMWGYQQHFANFLQRYAERVLSRLGARLGHSTLLVGVLRPGETNALPICIEPENGPLKEALFTNLADQIESIRRNHPDKDVRFGDEPRNRDHPEQIRRDSVRQAVAARLSDHDQVAGTSSLLSDPQIVGKYDVCPVLQFRAEDWNRLLQLKKEEYQGYALYRGLVEAVVYKILRDAVIALGKKDPGRYFDTFERDEIDVLRSAGRQLMYSAACVGGNVDGLDGLLFEECNKIASRRDEGREGAGGMVIARKGHPAIQVELQLTESIPLSDPGWARKILQVASPDLSLLSDGVNVYGLGSLGDKYDAGAEDAFIVRFLGHHKWELRHSDDVLMRVEYSVPELPRPKLDESSFKEKAARVFGGLRPGDAEELWRVVSTAIRQSHGTLIVITPAAETEAQRLRHQGTAIAPLRLTNEMITRVTSIDGALLIDRSGICHAIGVILDGLASPKGTPSRGARFNSAIRYVESAKSANTEVLAIVVSEDGSVDVLPDLPAQVEALKKKGC